MNKFTLRIGIRGFCNSCGVQLNIENAINLQAVPRIIIAKMIEDMEKKVEEYPCPHCLAKGDQIQDNWCLNHRHPSIPELLETIESYRKQNAELAWKLKGLEK